MLLLAIKNGKILALGKNDQILNKYSSIETIDLKGLFAYPGFIDAHCHFLAYGLQQGMVDVSSANSFQETIDILQKNIDKQNKNWLIGYGWDQNQWKDKNWPNNKFLNEHFKDLNIVLEINNKSLIKAEKILLEQAIGNIVNNALDFSPKSGTITIKASETNTAISIIVLDDGPGIPPHVLSKLFTRFFSVSRPDTGVRGNGLGLRFVRKIMQLHGGEVTLQNRFIQQGAEAKLRFPTNIK